VDDTAAMGCGFEVVQSRRSRASTQASVDHAMLSILVARPAGDRPSGAPGWHDVLVPQEPPSPTDPSREADMSRIALWLDPDDLRWLAAHCRCDDDATDLERERCARVRFRAHAALHKATTGCD